MRKITVLDKHQRKAIKDMGAKIARRTQGKYKWQVSPKVEMGIDWIITKNNEND